MNTAKIKVDLMGVTLVGLIVATLIVALLNHRIIEASEDDLISKSLGETVLFICESGVPIVTQVNNDSINIRCRGLE